LDNGLIAKYILTMEKNMPTSLTETRPSARLVAYLFAATLPLICSTITAEAAERKDRAA
jgi:hypothetical protein